MRGGADNEQEMAGRFTQVFLLEIVVAAHRSSPYRSLATLYLFRAGESMAAVKRSIPPLDRAKNVTEVD